MTKKKLSLVLITIFVLLALAACSSLKLPGSITTDAQSQQADPSQGIGEQPIEQKLAIGTLTLEGTDQAVTAEQAQSLLPLWKAIKSLSASSTATQDEIQAVYSQIQETMTTEQVQAIEDMTLSPEDMQSLMQKLGVQVPQENFDDGSITEDERATRIAQRAAQGGGDFQGPPEGGGMPGGAPPDGAGRGDFTGRNNPGAQITPMPGQQRRPGGGGMNTMFVDPLIKLLEERAGS